MKDGAPEKEAEIGAVSENFSAEEWEHITKNMFHGFVLDPGNLLPATIHLLLQGIQGEPIHYTDIISNGFRKEYPNFCQNAFDCILAAPGFSDFTRKEQEVANELLKQIKTKKPPILFFLRILQMLNKSGRASILVALGFTFSTSYDYLELRKMLIENNLLEGLIFIPSGILSPYTSISACIIVINKNKSNNGVYFYNIECDNISIKNNTILDDEILKMLIVWSHKNSTNYQNRSGNAFYVPNEEISDNNYSFSFDSYQKKVYDPGHIDDPLQLLASLERMSLESAEQLKSIREMFQ